jgi:LysR family nitrogen assimilation transcriptional regulator
MIRPTRILIRVDAINLRQLRYLAKTIEVANITRAAEQLNVAQPALGLQIRQLEDELGVPLLVRHSRGVSATAAGKVLYDRACEILRAVDDAKREIKGFAGSIDESVLLGLTPGITNLVGAEILVEAQSDLPNVHLSILEEMSFVLVESLERDEIDMALAYEVSERSGFVRTPLIEEEMLFVSASGTTDFDGDGIEFVQALSHPLVLAGDRDPARRMVAAAAEKLALPLNVAFEASSIAMMKSLIASGKAVGIMPFGSAADEIRRGELFARRIRNPAIVRTLYLVRSSRRAPFRAEREIQDFIRRITLRFASDLGPLGNKLPGLERSGQPELVAAK